MALELWSVVQHCFLPDYAYAFTHNVTVMHPCVLDGIRRFCPICLVFHVAYITRVRDIYLLFVFFEDLCGSEKKKNVQYRVTACACRLYTALCSTIPHWLAKSKHCLVCILLVCIMRYYVSVASILSLVNQVSCDQNIGLDGTLTVG